jgi:hypothetical protein
MEKELIKDLNKEYKEALKAWNNAKKEAGKKKQEFKLPKPRKIQIKVLLKGATKEKAIESKRKAVEEYQAKAQADPSPSLDAAGGDTSKFTLVQIKDTDMSLSLELIEDKKVVERKKSLDAEYKQAVKDWEKAKKEAKRIKKKFTELKPSKPGLKVLKKGMSMEKAKAALAKAEEDLKKKTASTSNKKKR